MRISLTKQALKDFQTFRAMTWVFADHFQRQEKPAQLDSTAHTINWTDWLTLIEEIPPRRKIRIFSCGLAHSLTKMTGRVEFGLRSNRKVLVNQCTQSYRYIWKTVVYWAEQCVPNSQDKNRCIVSDWFQCLAQAVLLSGTKTGSNTSSAVHTHNRITYCLSLRSGSKSAIIYAQQLAVATAPATHQPTEDAKYRWRAKYFFNFY